MNNYFKKMVALIFIRMHVYAWSESFPWRSHQDGDGGRGLSSWYLPSVSYSMHIQKYQAEQQVIGKAEYYVRWISNARCAKQLNARNSHATEQCQM